MNRFLLSFLFILLGSSLIKAQTFPVPYSFDTYSKINDSLYSNHQKLHTSIKPYLLQDTIIQTAFDSLLSPRIKIQNPNFLVRKIFNEHLVTYSREDFSFYFDFYPDFQVGKEFPNKRSLFTNTRGFELGGKIGKEIYFQTSYYTNQSKFPQYITNFIQQYNVVPGQGYIKPLANNSFDYANADGFISFTPSKYFTFQLGNGKNFIGDGYRSLLLSDNSYSYPYFKIITNVGPFRYMNMWAQLTDNHNTPFQDSLKFPHKWGVFQYLDWSIGHHVNIGVFENIMLQPQDFSLNYLNPIIFLVPVQFSEGSPGKVLIGFSGSYKFLNHYDLYGQLVIDEWTISKVLGDKGYWANKQGFQIGIKGYNLFNLPKLSGLLEFNNVRPFTYSANIEIKNYGNYNQPLADPFGANFKETIGIVNYSWKRFDFRGEFIYTFYGMEDPAHPTTSYGQDIYKPYTSRTSNEGYFIGSGIKTNFLFQDIKASYMLNYKNNLRLEIGFTHRSETNALESNKSTYLMVGLRGSFRNFYYDF